MSPRGCDLPTTIGKYLSTQISFEIQSMSCLMYIVYMHYINDYTFYKHSRENS